MRHSKTPVEKLEEAPKMRHIPKGIDSSERFEISLRQQEKKLQIQAKKIKLRREEIELDNLEKDADLKREIQKQREQRLAVRQNIGLSLTFISFIAGFFLAFNENELGYYLLGFSGTAGATKLVERKPEMDFQVGERA